METKKDFNNNNKDSKNKEFENKEFKNKESENKETKVVNKPVEDKEAKIKEIKAQIVKLENFIKNSNNAVNCALCHDRIKQLRKMIKDIEYGESNYKVKTVKNVPSVSQHKDQKGFVRGQITNTGEVFEML